MNPEERELTKAERVANAVQWKLIYPTEHGGNVAFLQIDGLNLIGPYHTPACALSVLFGTDCAWHDRVN